jgi:type II secretory pathway pseudopilin PulG
MDEDTLFKDPWGNEYIYKSHGPDEIPYEIISYGADGKPGGTGYNEDIYSCVNVKYFSPHWGKEIYPSQ